MLLFTRSTSVCLCGITPMTKSLIRKLIITRETIERRQWGYVAAKCHQQPGDWVARGKGAGCWARVTNILQRPKPGDAEDLRPPLGSRSTRQSSDGKQRAVVDREGAPRGSVCPHAGPSTALSHGSFPRVTQVTARAAPKGFSPHRSSASALCAARWINNTWAGKTSGGFQVFIWTLEVTFSQFVSYNLPKNKPHEEGALQVRQYRKHKGL